MLAGKEIDTFRIAQSMTELWLPLTDEQRQLLVDNISVRRYQKNEIIYHENDEPEYLFCLLKGKVKIYKEGVGGRQQIVRMARLKGFFGYRAGFAGGRYITEASAFESTTLCLIPLPVLKHIIRENQLVAIYFLKQLANLLGNADEHTVNLTQKHLRGRLAEALLQLKESYGTEDNERTLAISLSREDLANLSNMTTSNAIRTLSGFAGDGLISIDGRKISILDEQQLRKISKMG
ncbi:MAG: Crp/Fnr family transcriptional regulator [Prevotella sp.]|nr:Crp/Fnr family transcriptional regulator [Prevotella sp.]